MEPPLSSAKLHLLAVAEKAFADHGIDGVSLRQISELAGQKNVVAVQYHFKNRDNVIAAIINVNQRSLEALREKLFEEMAVEFDAMSTQQFIMLVIRPFLELKTPDGCRTFSRFLRALLQHDPYYRLWRATYAGSPFTDRIYRGLRNSISRLPDPIWELRQAIVGKLIVNSVADYDMHVGKPALSESAFLSDIVEIVTAAMRAPPPAELSPQNSPR